MPSVNPATVRTSKRPEFATQISSSTAEDFVRHRFQKHLAASDNQLLRRWERITKETRA
jgi:hypothetical protein